MNVIVRSVVLTVLFGWVAFGAIAHGASGTLPPNDDSSSGLIPLEFMDRSGDPISFRFYGEDYDSIYINNNGNVTFNGTLGQYTPDGFPVQSGRPMIAPFWADVDTRNGKGTVSYEGDETELKVRWTNVGYYNATDEENTNARNSFTLTIQRNNGILFEYGAMNWTTGDASDGVDGFGGTPATLGIDAGDGVRYQILGRFSGSNVASLEGTRWYFQTDNADTGTPLFKQFQAPWGSKKTLNSATNTMTSTGCFVTSTAMVLNALGHNTDPDKLNDFLKPHMNGGDLSFPAIPQRLSYGQDDGIFGPPARFRTGSFDTEASAGPFGAEGDTLLRDQIVTQLRSAVEDYGPIILRVPSRNWGSEGYLLSHTHAIVVDEVTEAGEVMIKDPGWSASPSTLRQYVAFVNNHVINAGHPDRVLKNADSFGTGVDFSWLANSRFTYAEALDPFKKKIIMGQANSPVEFVVRDALGRRLGRNPITGELFDEIPGSAYFRELAAAPADGLATELPSEGYGPVYFEIGDIVAGDYTFEVFGLDVGAWSIQFGISDPIRDFNSTQFFFQGTAAPGSIESQVVSVVPEPSSTVLLVIACMTAGLLSARKSGWYRGAKSRLSTIRRVGLSRSRKTGSRRQTA